MRTGTWTALCLVVGAACGAGLARVPNGLPPLPDTAHAAASSNPRLTGIAASSAVGPSRYPAEVLRVIDGDTFEARVRIWPGMDVTTKVRLRGIDAPELKARCRDERDRAEAARERLRAILAQGDVAIADVGLDKYGGRILASAQTGQTPDVSAAMLVDGLARAYEGGRRRSWCDGAAIAPVRGTSQPR